MAAFQTRSASASRVADGQLHAERELDLGDVAPDGVAVALQDLDLVGHLLDRAHRVPHVRVAGDRPQRLLLTAAADHDRQVPLDRRRGVAQVVERVAPARLGGDRLAVEDAPHGADRFVEPVEALAEAGPEVDAVRRVLELHPGAADAQDRPAVADVVERRGGLGDETRVAERVGTDEQPEPRLLGLACPGVEQRPALEDRLVRVAEDRVEVVPGP